VYLGYLGGRSRSRAKIKAARINMLYARQFRQYRKPDEKPKPLVRRFIHEEQPAQRDREATVRLPARHSHLNARWQVGRCGWCGAPESPAVERRCARRVRS
jgi:hypothetical protein